MNKLELEEHLSKSKASESGYPFGSYALVFKVVNKMFAIVSQKEKPARVTLKCRPVDAEVLVAQYKSIIPGYYMNKKHWITISLTDEPPNHMLIDLPNKSYKLVVSKLTKREKEQLQQQ
ncbi:MAG: MmcQ/YjbR family DNA-binding protein [Candidatus Thiodiazotropha sp. (ex Lucinoma aequizonata)]|nr:MmcQ/YjbR family DNA-binding protein [Candidatus Thiodiazotropha sp. (ex Lucinoma aequizonata)]MCU7887087.1 MmcQ/YjbR family DNA-binding protein [Candidatus Thiodiazotropha sp. (ex Lucinoma aequizonata)]MCU7895424.1 MmcQ/YjbR family DNA-binding protein [Candidatus Thiodiazotropha sp. (ex Lucinoma aequizonata)]MCU7899175.1 MmcQ/YjbR family DNA-binding protein [Candidatus Thiodiazotropha sp. (ex Lucinoma aequizonata)]MCU7902165.1 MmcQ/YjbR family DNA-binding protein [Candidatus Thiodiazotropha